ncbi:hypothetical protein Q7C36_007088 [Tachysurus vachellii]|uniref:FXYD domain-containing ion transport regulator n=1 Tax=Tachysurus vachellii TaxID=175792 RepID=A0AA88NKQ4_TACVA|nr:hypothetical protein Q7C36_007088 [Tachysurus vachellii]
MRSCARDGSPNPNFGPHARALSDEMELSLVALFCFSHLAPVLASTMDDANDYDSPFHYDYESVRIGGLVFAAVLFFLGIFVIISRKCHCRGRQAS